MAEKRIENNLIIFLTDNKKQPIHFETKAQPLFFISYRGTSFVLALENYKFQFQCR